MANRSRILLAIVCVAVSTFGWIYGYPRWVEYRQESYMLECQRAQGTNQWEKLQRLSTAWSQWQPESADAWIFRADAAQNLGDFEAAVDCLKLVPESSPKFLLAQVSLAALQFGPAKRPLDGVRTAHRLLEMEPRTTTVHQQLIEFYAITLQREKLLNRIRDAIELRREPKSAYVYLFLVDTMRLANAVQMNEEWLKKHPDAEVFLVARALQLPEPVAGSDPDEDNKHELVSGLMKRFPQNVELLAYQIDLAIRLGDLDRVAELMQRVPPSAEGDNRFWRAKGWLHLNRGELDSARDALKKALELHPLDWSARNWLADLTRREGDLEGAKEMEVLVRQARQLRESRPESTSGGNMGLDFLTQLADHARQCGDEQVAESLTRRLAEVSGSQRNRLQGNP